MANTRISAALAAVAVFAAAALALAAPGPSVVKAPDLRAELLRRVKDDQDARKRFVTYLQTQAHGSVPDAKSSNAPEVKRMRQIDLANREWLKRIVEKRGWPGKSLVGEDGAHGAWLLAQHADDDRNFQRYCLMLLGEAAATGEASRVDLAYLTDRVLVGEGRPQRYGTQTHQVNGQYVPDPTEDEPHVDDRRAAIGLPPMAVYVKEIRDLYTGKPTAGSPGDGVP